MKVYVSADIEGVADVTHWDDATKGKPGYEAAAAQMTAEVAAACEAAIAAGADEILVQDAHDSARNIDPSALPEKARLLRGWSDDPRCMAQELDSSYGALILVGHHAPSGSGGNPLSHTFSLGNTAIRINGEPGSEYLVLQYTAAYYGVPLVFLSGDAWIAAQAKRLNPGAVTLATKEGLGNSTISIHPALSVRSVREGAAAGLANAEDARRFALPPRFEVEIRHQHHGRSFKTGFYPGMRRVDDTTLVFEADDFYEVLRMFLFVGY
jgi:D-amino peptidase